MAGYKRNWLHEIMHSYENGLQSHWVLSNETQAIGEAARGPTHGPTRHPCILRVPGKRGFKTKGPRLKSQAMLQGVVLSDRASYLVSPLPPFHP